VIKINSTQSKLYISKQYRLFSMLAWLRRFTDIFPFQISLSLESSTLSFSCFIFLLTHSSYVFLHLYQPYLPPSTADTSLSSLHQISSPHFQTISIYYVLQPQVLHQLSYNSSDVTPLLSASAHIHPTIILSALCRRCREQKE